MLTADNLNVIHHEIIVNILLCLPLLPPAHYREGFELAERLSDDVSEQDAQILRLIAFFRTVWLPHKDKVIFENEDRSVYNSLRLWDIKLKTTFRSVNGQWDYFGKYTYC